MLRTFFMAENQKMNMKSEIDSKIFTTDLGRRQISLEILVGKWSLRIDQSVSEIEFVARNRGEAVSVTHDAYGRTPLVAHTIDPLLHHLYTL